MLATAYCRLGKRHLLLRSTAARGIGGNMTRISVTASLLVVMASVCSAETFQTLPSIFMTPGWTVDGITLQKICTTKWGQDARKVTVTMKQNVMNAYHFDIKTCPLSNLNKKRARRVEIDHLIPRSIGGADDERNLWPQCYELTKKKKIEQDDGAHKKDRLEAFLHKDVCAKKSGVLLWSYQQKSGAIGSPFTMIFSGTIRQPATSLLKEVELGVHIVGFGLLASRLVVRDTLQGCTDLLDLSRRSSACMSLERSPAGVRM